MYSEFIDLLSASLELTLLYLIYDILSFEIDYLICLLDEEITAQSHLIN